MNAIFSLLQITVRFFSLKMTRKNGNRRWTEISWEMLLSLIFMPTKKHNCSFLPVKKCMCWISTATSRMDSRSSWTIRQTYRHHCFTVGKEVGFLSWLDKTENCCNTITKDANYRSSVHNSATLNNSLLSG